MARGVVLVGAWLAASLFVGAQTSWYLRPFCGVAYVDTPFMLGTEPDFRGATSFYEALFHLIEPPVLSLLGSSGLPRSTPPMCGPIGHAHVGDDTFDLHHCSVISGSTSCASSVRDSCHPR
jgi:hypothetical protein